MKAIHITDLRIAVNAVRALAGFGSATFTDSGLAIGTPIKAVHLTELRSALDQVRAALSLPVLVYTRASITPQTSIISAADVYDLRDGVK